MSDRITYKVQGELLRAFDCVDPEVLVTGPAGTGKTIADHLLTLFRCLEFPGSRHLYIRQVRADLNDTIIPSLERVLAQCEEGRVALGDGCGPESRHRYVFSNGSVIVVGGLDRPQRTYSGEYDTVTVFEGTDTTEDAWQQFKRSLRHYKMPYEQLRMECNPDAPGHWIKRRADSGKMTPFYTTHKDNPAFYDAEKGEYTEKGLAYLATLESLTGFRRDRLLLGKWVGAEGVIYDNFEPTRGGEPWHVQRREGPWKRVFVAIDDGINDPFACLRICVDTGGALHIDSETYMRGLVMGAKIDAARSASPAYCVVDPAAGGLKTDLRAQGFDVRNGQNAILPGIDSVRRRFAETLDGKPSITIDPRCVNVIRELETYSWDQKAAQETPIDAHNHAMDALRYGCVHEAAPPPIVFEASELDELAAGCKTVSMSGRMICTLPDGEQQDRAIADQNRECVGFEPADGGSLTLWTEPSLRGYPKHKDCEYVMFAGVADGSDNRPSTIVVAEAYTRRIVAEWSRSGVSPERVARAACLLGLWFWGEKGPALLGVLRSATGVVALEHAQRMRYKRLWTEAGEVGWNPSPADLPEAIGLLRAAWTMRSFAEVDSRAIEEARQYVWKGQQVMPAWYADDAKRSGPWVDRVIVRAGLWRMLRVIKPPAPKPIGQRFR